MRAKQEARTWCSSLSVQHVPGMCSIKSAEVVSVPFTQQRACKDTSPHTTWSRQCHIQVLV